MAQYQVMKMPDKQNHIYQIGKLKRLLLTLHTRSFFPNSGSQQSSKLVTCSHPDTACINNEVRQNLAAMIQLISRK